MKKYYINLTEQERSQIIHSLIDKKNALMAQGRYTDAVDEVILKMMKAKKKAFINKKTGNQNERVVKEYLCKMNGITYFEVSANNRLDLADKIKRIFREKNIYILSDSQEDIEQCKKVFLRWKDKPQQ